MKLGEILLILGSIVCITISLYFATPYIHNKSSDNKLEDTTLVTMKRISPMDRNGLYYFEYKDEKFLVSSSGYITQIFNTKE